MMGILMLFLPFGAWASSMNTSSVPAISRRLTTAHPSRRTLLAELRQRQHRDSLAREPRQVYHNDAAGLRVHFPTSWIVRERVLGMLVSFVSPLADSGDRIHENINIVTQDIPPEEMSLTSYTAGTIRELLTFNPALHFAVSQAMTIGDNDAYSVTYQEPTLLGPLAFRQAWTVVGHTAYLFTLTTLPATFDEYNALFERMLQSATLGE